MNALKPYFKYKCSISSRTESVDLVLIFLKKGEFRPLQKVQKNGHPSWAIKLTASSPSIWYLYDSTSTRCRAGIGNSVNCSLLKNSGDRRSSASTMPLLVSRASNIASSPSPQTNTS